MVAEVTVLCSSPFQASSYTHRDIVHLFLVSHYSNEERILARFEMSEGPKVARSGLPWHGFVVAVRVHVSPICILTRDDTLPARSWKGSF